jgi:hypothetical protein
MSRFFQQLKENTITINTCSKSFEISHLKALLLMIVLCGLSSLLSYVLLGIFGNGTMFLVAFIAPAILYYIYTLCEDLVNPLFAKICFTQTNLDNQEDSTEEKSIDKVAPSNIEKVATSNE